MKHASLPLVYSFCAKLNSKVKETITLIQASLGMWKQVASTLNSSIFPFDTNFVYNFLDHPNLAKKWFIPVSTEAFSALVKDSFLKILIDPTGQEKLKTRS